MWFCAFVNEAAIFFLQQNAISAFPEYQMFKKNIPWATFNLNRELLLFIYLFYIYIYIYIYKTNKILEQNHSVDKRVNETK